MSKGTEFKQGDQVQILVGGPHENYGRIATISYFQDNGDIVLYFGDQDEDEFVYSPNEITKISINPDTGALDRVRALLRKWENAPRLPMTSPSVFAVQLRAALEGK